MNVILIGLVALFVVVAVLGYAAKVAMDIVQGIAKGIFGIEMDIINWLGRRSLGCRASIPDILSALSNSFQHFPLISAQLFPLSRFSENDFCDV